MMSVLRAHGMDAGPLQQPILAGLLSGLLATVPAGAVFVAFGSFQVVADQVMRLPRPLTAAVLLAAFTASGALYGLAFRRAANDRRGGWLFGAAFGFLLWMAAPIVALPLIGGSGMAAGTAATGFFACFLVWGTTVGAVFPFVHRPLHARMDGDRRRSPSQGGGARPGSLLRRTPKRWR
jgi:hypothetical protein